MVLRRLELKDIDGMLEWMHDEEINKFFQYPFANSTAESVEEFIETSFSDVNQHFAIVNEKDEYLGTISLKNISNQNRCAEYAIVLRKCAQGSGIAQIATDELVSYAFIQLHLHKIYLNVLSDNQRARKLYEKCGFFLEGVSKDAICKNGEFFSLAWYGIINV